MDGRLRYLEGNRKIDDLNWVGYLPLTMSAGFCLGSAVVSYFMIGLAPIFFNTIR